MDDALKGFRDAVEERKREDKSTENAKLGIIKQYEEWLKGVAVPTLETLRRELEEAEAGTEVEVVLIEPYGNPLIAGIEVIKPSKPKFVYRLNLHDRTGSERAFVMKERTAKNYDWRPDDNRSKRTQLENPAFFNERSDGRRNHAPEITSEDIIADFQRDYLAHRDEWF